MVDNLSQMTSIKYFEDRRIEFIFPTSSTSDLFLKVLSSEAASEVIVDVSPGGKFMDDVTKDNLVGKLT